MHDLMIASGNLIVPATTYRAIVGRLLRDARIARFPDQAAFAEAVGVSQPTLSRIESGSVGVSIDQLRRLTTALGTTPADILSRADTAATQLPRRGVKVVDHPDDSNQTLALLTGAALAALLIAVLANKK